MRYEAAEIDGSVLEQEEIELESYFDRFTLARQKIKLPELIDFAASALLVYIASEEAPLVHIVELSHRQAARAPSRYLANAKAILLEEGHNFRSQRPLTWLSVALAVDVEPEGVKIAPTLAVIFTVALVERSNAAASARQH